MSKIAAEHLSRQAFVYIRQSTFDQVQNNRESKLRQYGLADHAHQHGPHEAAALETLGKQAQSITIPP